MTNHNKTTSKCSVLPLFVVYLSNIICYFHFSKIKVCDTAVLLFPSINSNFTCETNTLKTITHPIAIGDQQFPISTEGKQEWSAPMFDRTAPSISNKNTLHI